MKVLPIVKIPWHLLFIHKNPIKTLYGKMHLNSQKKLFDLEKVHYNYLFLLIFIKWSSYLLICHYYYYYYTNFYLFRHKKLFFCPKKRHKKLFIRRPRGPIKIIARPQFLSLIFDPIWIGRHLNAADSYRLLIRCGPLMMISSW